MKKQEKEEDERRYIIYDWTVEWTASLLHFPLTSRLYINMLLRWSITIIYFDAWRVEKQWMNSRKRLLTWLFKWILVIFNSFLTLDKRFYVKFIFYFNIVAFLLFSSSIMSVYKFI